MTNLGSFIFWYQIKLTGFLNVLSLDWHRWLLDWLSLRFSQWPLVRSMHFLKFSLRVCPLTIWVEIPLVYKVTALKIFVLISEVSELHFANERIVCHCNWMIEWLIKIESHIAQLYLELETYMRLASNPGFLHLISGIRNKRFVPPCPGLNPISPLKHWFPLFSSQLKRNFSTLWWQNWKLSSSSFIFISMCFESFTCIHLNCLLISVLK